MSAEVDRITVFDFTKGVVATTSYDKWQREMSEGCRKAGHIFASCGTPQPGLVCLCGDKTWPAGSS